MVIWPGKALSPSVQKFPHNLTTAALLFFALFETVSFWAPKNQPTAQSQVNQKIQDHQLNISSGFLWAKKTSTLLPSTCSHHVGSGWLWKNVASSSNSTAAARANMVLPQPGGPRKRSMGFFRWFLGGFVGNVEAKIIWIWGWLAEIAFECTIRKGLEKNMNMS